MKIISLQAENFKKLHAVEITPDGNFVQITGKNGQGKSSTLDAIWVALAGIGVAPKAPIRKGAESAKIRLDLGEIVVTRHFKHAEKGAFTTSLTVESTDGARFPSPQKLLDSLLGALSLDPVKFLAMDDKEKFDALRKFVPAVDFDAIDRAHAGDYQRRTDVNRRQKDVRASAENIRVADKAPVEPIDESALTTKLKEAGDHNADIERRKANRDAFIAKITADERTCNEIRQDIADMERALAGQRENLKTSEASIEERKTKVANAEALPAPIDTAAVVAELTAARENNQKHAEWAADRKRRSELLGAADALVKESEELTTRIDQRQRDKQAAIAAAKLPIEGISFGDGAVLLNDLPFDQASDAEKLRASVAIAMAGSPKLPVVLIRDGSLLDEDGLRLVAEMADARGAQVWIERVSNAGNIGIVLEDGYVKAKDEAPTAEAQERAAS
jgi:hypothetical protein